MIESLFVSLMINLVALDRGPALTMRLMTTTFLLTHFVEERSRNKKCRIPAVAFILRLLRLHDAGQVHTETRLVIQNRTGLLKRQISGGHRSRVHARLRFFVFRRTIKH